VVDWADIYKLQPGADLLKPNGAIGMHAVFAARSMVDLVLIASVLQAIGIVTRNRQQKALYNAGHIDRLDELVEKAELKRILSTYPGRPPQGCINLRRYNRERLKELYTSSTDSKLRSLIESIFDEDPNDTLDPPIVVLSRIASTHRNEAELHRMFEAVRREHHKGNNISVGDLVEILTNLRAVSGLRDLKSEILRFAASIGSPAEIEDMMMRVIAGSLRDAFQYTRIEAARLLTKAVPLLTDPSAVSEAISIIERNRDAAFGAATYVPTELLNTLSRQLDLVHGQRQSWKPVEAAPAVTEAPAITGEDSNHPRLMLMGGAMALAIIIGGIATYLLLR
jgi:hypothetical protein